MFKIAAFGIILNKDGEVLLCHRRDMNLWNLPGGGCEKNESPWKCAKREIEEETRLSTNIKELKGIYFKSKQKEIVFTFLCNKKKGNLKKTKEADKVKYFKFKQIPKNTPLKHIERIKHVLNNKKIVMKLQ